MISIYHRLVFSIRERIKGDNVLIKSKLNSINLHSNIHTISICSTEYPKIKADGVTRIHSYIREQTGELTYTTQINPNKYVGSEVYNYNDFQNILNEIVKAIGINEYRITRVDFKIDSYNDNYNELLKLNKLVILLLSIAYNIKNRYQSFEPLTLENLTVRVQNEYLEAENYNKGIESNYTDIAQNRLEVRSKALLKTKKSIPELLDSWLAKFDALPQYFEQLQSMCNTEIVRRWPLEQNIKVKSLSEYIRKYQDNIYSRKQLIELYDKIGIVKPTKAVYNFDYDNTKHNTSIEYISAKELKLYLAMIKKSLLIFTDITSNIRNGGSRNTLDSKAV